MGKCKLVPNRPARLAATPLGANLAVWGGMAAGDTRNETLAVALLVIAGGDIVSSEATPENHSRGFALGLACMFLSMVADALRLALTQHLVKRPRTKPQRRHIQTSAPPAWQTLAHDPQRGDVGTESVDATHHAPAC